MDNDDQEKIERIRAILEKSSFFKNRPSITPGEADKIMARTNAVLEEYGKKTQPPKSIAYIMTDEGERAFNELDKNGISEILKTMDSFVQSLDIRQDLSGNYTIAVAANDINCSANLTNALRDAGVSLDDKQNPSILAGTSEESLKEAYRKTLTVLADKGFISPGSAAKALYEGVDAINTIQEQQYAASLRAPKTPSVKPSGWSLG